LEAGTRRSRLLAWNSTASAVHRKHGKISRVFQISHQLAPGLVESDQDRGLPAPSPQKAYPADASLLDLVAPDEFGLGRATLLDLIRQRKSRRKYSDQPLSLEELSFLLWATQGVRQVTGGGNRTWRTVPSSGGRHPFETYLVVNRVAGLATGLYRYLALEHKLLWLRPTDQEWLDKLVFACRGQEFLRASAVTFIWTAIPYRAEWRYANEAHKTIALDAGHVCQNLYLACEAIGAGTCAVAAYAQNALDALLGVDGQDEFALYVAAVGKPPDL
jgi:SagB-type dehydrogenase family enzyme